MYKTLKLYLIFCLPLALKCGFLLIYVDLDLFTRQDLLEDVFFIIVFGLIYFYFINKKKFITDSILFIYILYFILETGPRER